ncbi:MAG: DUF971 domain-containing protein [Puniceicoccaceae bacterium]|nr:MAG: DUF971 domain-containing protein [Puniceicoccaceae bacterium]
MIRPRDLQAIGDEIAILWEDGAESYYRMSDLRAASPSAEARGEADLFGRVHGGERTRSHDGVRVDSWEWVGGYAVRFIFSDGHRTGLYSFAYLRELADRRDAPPSDAPTS